MSISYRQSTGYYSYMSHTNNTLCRPMFKQFYCSKNACDPIEYKLKGGDIEPAGLTFAQAQRQGGRGGQAVEAEHDMC